MNKNATTAAATAAVACAIAMNASGAHARAVGQLNSTGVFPTPLLADVLAAAALPVKVSTPNTSLIFPELVNEAPLESGTEPFWRTALGALSGDAVASLAASPRLYSNTAYSWLNGNSPYIYDRQILINTIYDPNPPTMEKIFNLWDGENDTTTSDAVSTSLHVDQSSDLGVTRPYSNFDKGTASLENDVGNLTRPELSVNNKERMLKPTETARQILTQISVTLVVLIGTTAATAAVSLKLAILVGFFGLIFGSLALAHMHSRSVLPR